MVVDRAPLTRRPAIDKHAVPTHLAVVPNTAMMLSFAVANLALNLKPNSVRRSG